MEEKDKSYVKGIKMFLKRVDVSTGKNCYCTLISRKNSLSLILFQHPISFLSYNFW